MVAVQSGTEPSGMGVEITGMAGARNKSARKGERAICRDVRH